MKTEVKYHGHRIFKYSFEGEYSKEIYANLCKAIKVKSDDHYTAIAIAILNAMNTFKDLKNTETFTAFVKCKEYTLEIAISA